MKWFFQPYPKGYVETEVTQRDQFSNDSVSLNETIVREAVQNSLDAVAENGQQVKVLFRWLDSNDGLQTEYFHALLDDQLVHARAASLDVENVDFSKPRALVIEDFGTKGLTGAIEEKDEDHFSDFWRRHGKSHKSGKSRGRWGLGKLVYSTTSEIGVFFGLTLRNGDPMAHLMGQSVLNLYNYDGKQYPPHSFFGDHTNPGNILENIAIPVRNTKLVESFREHFKLSRTTQSGLSIVIPFQNESFDKTSMIKVAIENYFYPIITDQLSLVFDSVEINRGNIKRLANEHNVSMHSNIDMLFNFIEDATKFNTENLLTLRSSWSDDKKLGEDDFDENELLDLKEKFHEGSLCSVRLPLTLRKRVSLHSRKEILVDTYITAFIQRPQGLEAGLDLYVRGGLTLPAEQKFRGRRSLGVVIANDDAICDFLGDAENPAHTKWNKTTEKLKNKYISPQSTIGVIQDVLVNLYDLLAEVEEEKDEVVLGQFFSMEVPEEKGRSKKGNDGKKQTPRKPVVPPLKPKNLKIQKLHDGFSISTTDFAAEDQFPVKYKITLAYDDGSSNPFKKYNVQDFKVGKGGNINARVVLNGLQKLTRPGRLESATQNELIIHIEKPPFLMEVTGFDRYRDLKVTYKKIKLVDADEVE